MATLTEAAPHATNITTLLSDKPSFVALDSSCSLSQSDDTTPMNTTLDTDQHAPVSKQTDVEIPEDGLHAPLEPSSSPRMQHSSLLSLSERRGVRVTPEKLDVATSASSDSLPSVAAPPADHDSALPTSPTSPRTATALRRLVEENAKLPPQDSEDFLLAHLDRQNALLSADPKSVCIESNRLKADFTTMRRLIAENTSCRTEEDKEGAMLDVDWDFWQYLVSNFPTAAAKLPHLLSAKLRYGGIPHRLRGLVWQAMSQSTVTHLEVIYDRLLNDCDPSPYERIIQRDLTRTFPSIDMFKLDGGEGQQAMGRLLSAYSIYDAHVGYCQGLAFLIGPLLMTMPERQAFCVFVRLMETYEMRTMFTLNMEGLHLRLHQFKILLAELCPRLDAHLTAHNIQPAMYASQWFLTLFAYSFPLPLVLRVYDLSFAEGAIETITRVAVAIMKKNEENLLSIDDFESLIMYLASPRLYDEAYGANAEEVIADSMALGSVISKSRLDDMAQAYHHEMQRSKERTQQELATQFDPSTRRTKRESWFSWGSSSDQTMKHSVSTNTLPTSPITPNSTSFADQSTAVLHQQVEDLVSALSQLQKEHQGLSVELQTLKGRDSEYDQVARRNSTLEKRLRKYKHRLSKQKSQTEPLPDMEEPIVPLVTKEKEKETETEMEDDTEFRTFMDSLRMSGDFGSLIAGALFTDSESITTDQDQAQIQAQAQAQSQAQDQDPSPEAQEDEDEDAEETDEDNQQPSVVSELVAMKLAHFEMSQKYDQLRARHEETQQALEAAQQEHDALNDKMMGLESQLEQLEEERGQLVEAHDAMLIEHEELLDKSLASKKMSTELQQEKLDLARQVEDLETKVRQLEEEKREYLMPRGSFAEEVFAAHHVLFGKEQADDRSQPPSRRHTLQMGDTANGEYRSKYIESELRCRELEKILAETKVKLAEYESQPSATSRRSSLQHHRTSSIQAKRASLSLLARTSTPSSPCDFATPFPESRQSTESLASTLSSCSTPNNLQHVTNMKRASAYARLWGALQSCQSLPPLPSDQTDDDLSEVTHVTATPL